MAPIDPDHLSALVSSWTGRLRRITDQQSSAALNEGEWSPRQLLGHLVDSALNNYDRIIRAQIPAHRNGATLHSPGYDQEGWVEGGKYQSRSWPDLIELWQSINQQLIHALRAYDPAALGVPLSIAGGPSTPIGTALDYLDHLEEHLNAFPTGDTPALRLLPEEISGDGLVLRARCASDAKAVIAAVQDPEIPRWTSVPSPFGMDEWDAAFQRDQDWQATGDLRRNYFVTERDASGNDVLVGMCSLVRVRAEDRDGEVGYWVAKHARGRGVATRALRLILREVLLAGYQRISAEVIVGNEASERVLLAVGFTREGVFRSVGTHGTGHDQHRIDVVSFSLLPTDTAATELLGS